MTHRLCAAILLSLFAPLAAAKTCELSIDSNDQMQFVEKELKVAADCTEVSLTLKHSGKIAAQVMGHNWVLTKTADFQPVANAGVAAGLAGDYVPAGDDRVIAHTKVIGGGETTSVKFSTKGLEKGGDYTYFCSFPGHWAIMKGKFIFG